MQNYLWIEKKLRLNKRKVFSVCWRISLVLAGLSIAIYLIFLKASGLAIIQPKTQIAKTLPTIKVNDLLGVLNKGEDFFYIKSDASLIRKSSYNQIDSHLPHIIGLNKNNITAAVCFLKQLGSLQSITLKVSFEDIKNIKMHLKGDIVVNVGCPQNLDEKFNKLKLLLINYSKLPAGMNVVDLRWKDVIIKADNFDSD